MFGYAFLRVRDRSAAEDLVQEALLAALGAADGFKGESSEQTWLIGILKHKVLDFLRRRAREGNYATEGDPQRREVLEAMNEAGHWNGEVPAWADPERALEQDQFQRVLAGCIEGLPEKLATVFTLRELDGMETDEIMEVLGISSRNNVWVILSRAREQLRRCLNVNWFGD